MEFPYFYEEEVDMFSFYRIPKLLFTDERFKGLSIEAKVLYGLMLDRMSLSAKNQWLDGEKRVYIYFSLEDVMEHLNCKKNKAVDIMKELDEEKGVGLIERVRQGQGKPSRIYVKNFVEKPEQRLEKQTSDSEGTVAEVDKTNLLRLEKAGSGSPFYGSLEDGKVNQNNIKENNTESSKTESNLILSGITDETIAVADEMLRYAEIIRENIALEELLYRNPSEQELIQGIFDLILETVLYQDKKIVIASNSYPAQLVRSKFLKLTYFHVTYVLDCMKRNTTRVRNIKKYLLAALFNAPTTIGGYYQAEVNHDMPQLAVGKLSAKQ